MQEATVRENLQAVVTAIAQQRLEGLEVPPEVEDAMRQAARGELTIEEGVRATVRRFAHDPL
ncbi:MAG: antitoxin VbhA family protein [Acidobacteriota bacterium]